MKRCGKETETIKKKNQIKITELKNTIVEDKNALSVFNS